MERMRRSAYNQVASTEEAENVEHQSTAIPGTESPSNISGGGTNGNLSGVSVRLVTTTTTTGSRSHHGVDAGNHSRLNGVSSKDDVVNSSTSLVDSMEKNQPAGGDGRSDASDSDGDSVAPGGEGEAITVIVLDSAQKRFPVAAYSDWTVQTFKKAGWKVHKVAPASQRLIFRGRMLDDSKTLKEMGIHQDDVIIHLFPKPRVIVADSSVPNVSTDGRERQDEGGAHVPQIILDEAEQERRGQILVLGSYEISEAQNNVRLLSLLLGTICVMRLLALLSVATGADEVPAYTDDITPPMDGSSNSTDGDGMYPHVDYEERTWEKQDYFDLVVSTVGFIVARLGMKATQENTSRLATQYLIGTLIAGILWNIWNVLGFVVFVKEESAPTDDDNVIALTNDDFRTIALFTVILPLGIWFLCCARAWQFRHLIEEAEQEAADRIRSELNLVEGRQSSEDRDEENNSDLEARTSSNERPTIV